VHTRKACKGAKIELHSFLALALDGCQWSASHSGHITTREEHFVLIEQETGWALELH